MVCSIMVTCSSHFFPFHPTLFHLKQCHDGLQGAKSRHCHHNCSKVRRKKSTPKIARVKVGHHSG